MTGAGPPRMVEMNTPPEGAARLLRYLEPGGPLNPADAVVGVRAIDALLQGGACGSDGLNVVSHELMQGAFDIHRREAEQPSSLADVEKEPRTVSLHGRHDRV